MKVTDYYENIAKPNAGKIQNLLIIHLCWSSSWQVPKSPRDVGNTWFFRNIDLVRRGCLIKLL